MLVSFFGAGGDESPDGAHSPNAGDSAADYNSPIARARRALRNTQDGDAITDKIGSEAGAPTVATFDMDDGARIVHKWLKVAGVDASALDPEGKKSAAEMETVINDAPKLGYISKARQYLAEMTAGGPSGQLYVVAMDGAAEDSKHHDALLLNPHDMAKAVRSEIERASKIAVANGEKPVDLSALDPTGKKSAAEMERTVNESIKENYVLQARRAFLCIYGVETGAEKDVYHFLDEANKAAKEFGLAPVDASVLDSAGKRSAPEMERAILKAAEEVYVNEARWIFRSHSVAGMGLHRGLLAEDDKKVSDDLWKANEFASKLGEKPIDDSVFDPHQNKRTAEIDDFAKTVDTRMVSPEGRMSAETAALLGCSVNSAGDPGPPLQTPRTRAAAQTESRQK